MRWVVLFCLFALQMPAQSFTFTTTTYSNGEKGPMQGVPGDLFMATLTFSNSSNSEIIVFIDRIKKSIPAYWRSCYCYTMCADPSTDTVRISVPAFGTRDITIQFKTDSVNPGLATSDFTMHQLGVSSATQGLSLQASTIDDVGIPDAAAPAVNILTKPGEESFYYESLRDVEHILVADLHGGIVYETRNAERSGGVHLPGIAKGIYLVRFHTSGGAVCRKWLAN
jgi:hypothetical protein